MRRPIRLSGHARWSMARRGLDETTIRSIVESPEEVVPTRDIDREVRQRLVPFPPDGRGYLVRVIVENRPDEIVVITAYRTSQIERYRGQP